MRKSIACICALAWFVGSAGDLAVAGPPVSEVITYQGQLSDAGAPATGAYDFQFSLYDAVVVGSQISITLPRNNVDVAKGLFVVGLDWPTSVFDGSDRYLEVEVRPSASSGAYTMLSPRQALYATPYAIHAGTAGGFTLPFAGSVATSGDAVAITNTGTGVAGAFEISNATNNAPAIWATSNGQNDTIVSRNTGTGGAGHFSIINPGSTANAMTVSSDGDGIALYTEQSGGERAGYFLATYGGNTNAALEAETHGTGEAGHFHIDNGASTAAALRSSTNGVGPALFAQTTSVAGTAVHGYASGTGADTNFGGFMRADADDGVGVHGSAIGIRGVGVYGFAHHPTGDTFAVAGIATSPNGYAGYFMGRSYLGGKVGISQPDPDQALHVEGNVKVSGWIGSDEAKPVTLQTDDQPVLTLSPASDASHGFAPNLVGGHPVNYTAPGVIGGFVGGGGYEDPNPQIGPRANRVVGRFGAVAGGYGNQAAATSFVGGGTSNAAGHDADIGPYKDHDAGWATIGGGQSNEAYNSNATIGGGVHNQAHGVSSTIGGGQSNLTGNDDDPPFWFDGQWATVGGGYGNVAELIGTTIPGGSSAFARIPYQWAYSAGSFGNDTGNAQTSIYTLRHKSSYRGPHRMATGSYPLTVPDGVSWVFEIFVVARAEDGTSAAYQITGAVKGQGATTSFIGNPTIKTIGEDSGASSWSVDIITDDFFEDHRLEIQVYGADDTTIRWVATVRTTEVSWAE